MKIASLVRTRNEQRNIQRWINGYKDWVDYMLIADGGSEDKTIEIIEQNQKKCSNLLLRHFTEKIEGGEDYWRNPEGKHINFLIDWAKELEVDWIIMDDCDSFPTKALKEYGRKIFEDAEKEEATRIMIYHIYVWLDSQWFPEMNVPGQGAWAWKTSINLRMSEEDGWRYEFQNYPKDKKEFKLEHPYAVLHCFAQTEELAKEKMDFYKIGGKEPHTLHPLAFGGTLELLREWMIE